MSEETIFAEVNEELRRDRMRSGWRRYGPYLIAAAVLAVLLVAANEGWSWWQNSHSSQSSDQFFTALELEDGGDLAGAQKALDALIASGTGQYPVLAKFKQAGLLGREGKLDEALKEYDGLANSAGNPRLKDLALLLGGYLLVDKGDVAAVKQRVQGLLTPNNPLRNAASEAVGLAQYKSKDLAGAMTSFEAVVGDPMAPQDARSRMQLYMAQLVAQGAPEPKAAADAAPAAAGAAAVEAIGAAAPANDNAAPAAAETPAAPTAPASQAAPAAGAAAPATDSAAPAAAASGGDAATPAAPAAGSSQ